MRYLTLLLFLLESVLLAGQTTDSLPDLTSSTFELGEVLVKANRMNDTFHTVSVARMEQFNRLQASTALNLLPGVTLANVGPRNESVVYIRGFDLRQVPVFIDGVPVYVPYDGYVDLARFTTADLSSVRVDKGFSSLLYGPNTMGGAINLVSRKPDKKLEYDARLGTFSGEGRRLSANVGSNFGQWYLQGNVSYLEQATFPLSADFEPVETEDGGNREKAGRSDFKVNLKAGFRPNDTDEYALGYVRQEGVKGNPPYTGTDPDVRIRFWDWPFWDKESLYFLSNTQIGRSSSVSVRLYYDRFENALFSYDDATYTTQERPFAFQSFYDDYAYGGNARFSTQFSPSHELQASVYFKHDTHRENNLGEPQRRMADNTFSLALEDQLSLNSRLRLSSGMSYNLRSSIAAEDYLADENRIVSFEPNDNAAFNLQAGLWYDLSKGQTLRLTAARKTRFATIKDRYSYRLGRALPNPELEAEAALHLEVSYQARLLKDGRLSLEANLYQSNLSNTIQQVDNVQDGLFQLQNTGSSRFRGAELSLAYRGAEYLGLGANYSYIEQENLNRPDIRFTNVPPHKFFVYGTFKPWSPLEVLLSAEYNDRRFSQSYGVAADAFTVVNTSAEATIRPWLRLQGGINNLLDTHYELVEGFPEAGRNFFLTLIVQNP